MKPKQQTIDLDRYSTSDLCEFNCVVANKINNRISDLHATPPPVFETNDEEYITEMNTKLVSSFINHCKREGIEIPDSMFESYFNA